MSPLRSVLTYFIGTCIFILTLTETITLMLLLGALCVFFRLAIMADVDPDTLLEWLQMGQGDERDMQLIALEQLCMLLLMSDNVDRCFET